MRPLWMRAGVIVLTLVVIGFFGTALVVFFDQNGRLPSGSGEMFNWMLGWEDSHD